MLKISPNDTQHHTCFINLSLNMLPSSSSGNSATSSEDKHTAQRLDIHTSGDSG